MPSRAPSRCRSQDRRCRPRDSRRTPCTRPACLATHWPSASQRSPSVARTTGARRCRREHGVPFGLAAATEHSPVAGSADAGFVTRVGRGHSTGGAGNALAAAVALIRYYTHCRRRCRHCRRSTVRAARLWRRRTHWPVAGSQVPASWHGIGGHSTAAPADTLAAAVATIRRRHQSAAPVQALPSEQGVPLGSGGEGALAGRRVAGAGLVTRVGGGRTDDGRAGDALACCRRN